MLRVVSLASLAVGLALAPYVEPPKGWILCLPIFLTALVVAGRGQVQVGIGISSLKCLLAAGLAVLLGLGIGGLRVAAIDSGAMGDQGAEPLLVRGHVSGSAWRERGEVRVPVATPEGRVMVVVPEKAMPRSPPVGRLLKATGDLRQSPVGDDFMAGRLRRIGISHELHTDAVELLRGRRGGLPGILDRARISAERGVSVGLDSRQADLARGFVLGGDDRIDPATEEAFRRTGLTHLLAVSGQNVMLLAILAGVVLGILGLRLRARLMITILLIALYVPITGAGASIQRAAVMGSAGLLATVLGRPSDRAFTLALALAATLVVNPRFTGDVGWQLSFAAVVGIGLWAGRVRALLIQRGLLSRLPDRVAGPVAEAIGITAAATIATAPLVAFTFERVSPVSLLANVLVAPAVAPTMWLGMAASAIGQLPRWPLVAETLGVIGALATLSIDYIAWVARELSAVGWAETAVEPPSIVALLLTYVCLAVGVGAVLAIAERRSGLFMSSRRLALPVSLIALLLLTALNLSGGESSPPPAVGSRYVALDVGQGDATLLQPRRGLPVLVDAGPADAGVVDRLHGLGVHRLGALLVTHDQSDHVGGALEVLARMDVDLVGRPLPVEQLDAAASSHSVEVATLRAGRVLRSGSLRIEVLWPGMDLSSPSDDPNATSLVLLATMSGARLLLTGDAEQEMTHLRPGPVDVLKVAHHGSTDTGLGALLDSARPAIATISAGEDNPYGHPSQETTSELSEAAVCTLRTDRDGTVAVDLERGGAGIWTEMGTALPGESGCVVDDDESGGVRSRPRP